MKMRVVIFFALFVVCKGGYPAAIPEVVAPTDSFIDPPEAPTDSYGPPQSPSDSYGAPVKAPVDSYTPPTKLSLSIAPVQEILSTPAPESVTTEIVAAAPAQSASFNFLSELTAPPLVTLGVAETSLKAATALQQETANAPLTEQFQLNIPGLVPPITSFALPPAITPVQVLPPAVFPPPQSPVPVPFPLPSTPIQPVPAPIPLPSTPIQPVPAPIPLPSTPIQPVPAPIPLPTTPVQPAPVTVQTLALQSNPAPVPVTKITAQEISVPRVQTAFIPQENYQVILPSVTPFNIAPYFYHANTLPATLLAPRKILPQLTLNSQLAAEVLNLQSELPNTVVETSAVKTAPALIEAPSTSYGTPILETLHKKK